MKPKSPTKFERVSAALQLACLAFALAALFVVLHSHGMTTSARVLLCLSACAAAVNFLIGYYYDTE